MNCCSMNVDYYKLKENQVYFNKGIITVLCV